MAGLSRTNLCCLVGVAAGLLFSACSQDERAAAGAAPGTPPRAAQRGSPLAPSDLPCPVAGGYTTVIELAENEWSLLRRDDRCGQT